MATSLCNAIFLSIAHLTSASQTPNVLNFRNQLPVPVYFDRYNVSTATDCTTYCVRITKVRYLLRYLKDTQ